MSRVCVFLADGFEEVEALTVVDLLLQMLVGIPVKRQIVFDTLHQPAALVGQDVGVILPADPYDRACVQITLLDDMVRVGFQVFRNGAEEPLSFNFFSHCLSPFG